MKDKATITWRAGWIFLWPLRIFICILFAVIASFHPAMFYGLWRAQPINDSKEWKI